jgi:hypothetical protein
MALESHRYAADQDQRVAFHDHARGMTVERATACISFSCNRNAMYGCGAGRDKHLAAVTGKVTESNHIFHVVLQQSFQFDNLILAETYRSAIHCHTVMP